MKYLQREFERIEEDYADDSEFDEATSEALSTATKLFADPTERERALLKQMKTLAEAGKAQRDSKAKQLIAWLKEHLKPKGKWTNERVIIFTEYRATQNWLQEVLATEGFSGDDRLMTMFGGMDPDKREAVKAAFQTSPELSKVRILLATDSASEGLDLQNFCSKLIHYEIPWNPNRMEQRNGRVDRHGQKADRVMVYHFVGQGWTKGGSNDVKGASDLSGDLEFLMRVALKIETIREDLGKVGPVLAQQVEEAMLGHRSTLNLDDAEKAAQPIRRMLKFERDLRKQVKELMDQYLETRRELNLSPDNIQKVVQIALELAGQPGLIPAKDRRRSALLSASGFARQLGGLCGRLAASAYSGDSSDLVRRSGDSQSRRCGAGASESPVASDVSETSASRSVGRQEPIQAPAGDRASDREQHHRKSGSRCFCSFGGHRRRQRSVA